MQINPVSAEVEGVKITKLWENPDATADFAAQNIDLSSDDYTFLLVFYKYYKAIDRLYSCIVFKGTATTLFCPIIANTEICGNPSRQISFNTYTSLGIGACDFQTISNGGAVSTTQNNASLIPYAIYGIK